ncbi:MAG: Uncharacterized protein Greene07147_68 [Parcubacteria group bacterium Greene0714_7]|nr:MAG: Uncharacterized protein Greene07147_68 [Parcubacteria group bacterium Greene0714_7]
MALAATHIRFALDLKEKYGVSDTQKYIAGTLYPDSRYVTGIDRTVTHPTDLDDAFFKLDDFKKGWFVHLVCDNMQYQITTEWIPDAFKGIKGQNSETWIKRSALKVLQDIDDIRKFNFTDYLPALEYVETPNGELEKEVRQYNKIFSETHREPSRYGINDACEMWRRFGIGDELVEAIRKKSGEYANNSDTMNILRKIYPEMLARAKQF